MGGWAATPASTLLATVGLRRAGFTLRALAAWAAVSDSEIWRRLRRARLVYHWESEPVAGVRRDDVPADWVAVVRMFCPLELEMLGQHAFEAPDGPSTGATPIVPRSVDLEAVGRRVDSALIEYSGRLMDAVKAEIDGLRGELKALRRAVADVGPAPVADGAKKLSPSQLALRDSEAATRFFVREIVAQIGEQRASSELDMSLHQLRACVRGEMGIGKLDHYHGPAKTLYGAMLSALAVVDEGDIEDALEMIQTASRSDAYAIRGDA